MAKKNIPRLLVVFDTNALFTQAASDLVLPDIKRIVKDNSNHPDLSIEWCLPEVVIGERKYQMMGKAKELLPNMKKLEKLLGHNFAIDEDTLELHVNKAIETTIEECKFHKIGIDTKDVDWDKLISRSVKREPPFEATEKEKGFRDSIIAHSFLHLLKRSPATPSICRLALISEDKKLSDYVSELTVGSKNVRILKNIDELENLINTLVSTIPEELAIDLAKKAAKLFYDFGKKSEENVESLYLKEDIVGKIKGKYPEILSDAIIPDHQKMTVTYRISNPIFKRKEKNCIHWSSTIENEFEIFHYESEAIQPGQSGFSTSGAINLSSFTPNLKNTWAPSAFLHGQTTLLGGAIPKKVVDLTGKDIFEIQWSTNLTQAHNLNMPKLGEILYVGNNLADITEQ